MHLGNVWAIVDIFVWYEWCLSTDTYFDGSSIETSDYTRRVHALLSFPTWASLLSPGQCSFLQEVVGMCDFTLQSAVSLSSLCSVPLVSESCMLLGLVCVRCHWGPTLLEVKDGSLSRPVAFMTSVVESLPLWLLWCNQTKIILEARRLGLCCCYQPETQKACRNLQLPWLGRILMGKFCRESRCYYWSNDRMLVLWGQPATS